MRLGLHTPRRSSFWLTGPVAAQAFKRGHEVTFLRDARALKPGDNWFTAECEAVFPGARFASVTDYDGDWLAGPPPKQNMTPADWNFVERSGIQVCSIDPWLDSLAMPYDDHYDLTHRTPRHGLVPSDGLEHVIPQPPTDLLWFPPKSSVKGWRSRATHWLVLCAVSLACKRFAYERNWRLVIKTRPKIRLPKFVTKLADELVSDTALYPHDSLTYLARAHYAVCHQSAAAMEAAAAGVRSLSIHLPQRHLRSYPHYALMRARFGSPYAWPGVVDCKAGFQRVKLETEMDWNARAAYIDTWLGGRVMGTSDWLLDEMEKRA